MPDRFLLDAVPGENPSHQDVQQIIEAEAGEGPQGIVRRWQASDSAQFVLTSDAGGVKISRNNGATAPAQVIVDGTAAGGALGGTYPTPGFAPSPTFTGTVTINGSLAVTNNATVGGTLGVSGPTSLSSLNTTSNATVGGTLGVTGVTTLSVLNTTSSATVGGELNVSGDLHVGGSVTLGNAPADRVDIPGGLVVVGAAELRGSLDHDGAFLGVFAAPPTTQRTVTGSRAGNAALGNLLNALDAYGLIVNNTSA